MQPRLQSSNKWTPFPTEYMEQIQSALDETFKKYLELGKLIIEGRIYREELLFRLGFLEQGRLKQLNFEASIGYSQDQDGIMNSLNACLECCTNLLWEYLEKMHAETVLDRSNPDGTHDPLEEIDPLDVSLEDAMDLPYTWTQIEFQDRPIHIQFTTINTQIEIEANILLGEAFEHGLFNEAPESFELEEPLATNLQPDSQDQPTVESDESIIENANSDSEVEGSPKNEPQTDNIKAPYRDGRDLFH